MARIKRTKLADITNNTIAAYYGYYPLGEPKNQKYFNLGNFLLSKKENEKNILANIIYSLNKEISYGQTYKPLKELYFKAQTVSEDYILETEDKGISDFHYVWVPKSHYLNLFLGYIVDCCARYHGNGEGIMMASLFAPEVKNLIIINENDHIVGKATAYLNKDGQYILFNTLVLVGSNKRSKSKYLIQNERKILAALMRAIRDQVRVQEKSGILINNALFGWGANDLPFVNIDESRYSYKSDDSFPNYDRGHYWNCADTQKLLYQRKKK